MKLTRMFTPSTKLKKCAQVVTLAMAALSVLPASAATLKISHVRPQGTVIDNDIKQLGEEIKTATNGDVKLRVYAANALGDYTLVQERISVGAVDMAVQPASTATDRKMQLGLLPYLANNWQEAQKIYGDGAPVRETMEELFAKQDITLLAAYPVYLVASPSTVMPNHRASPISIKGSNSVYRQSRTSSYWLTMSVTSAHRSPSPRHLLPFRPAWLTGSSAQVPRATMLLSVM